MTFQQSMIARLYSAERFLCSSSRPSKPSTHSLLRARSDAAQDLSRGLFPAPAYWAF